MLDPRKDTIIYQSQVYYSDLVNTLVATKKLGKTNDSKWTKAKHIRQLLKATNYIDLLTDQTDIDNVNYILECLIKICELNQFPVASPLNYQSPPNILFGLPGLPGTPGVKGDRGDTGLATDFQTLLATVPAVVDSFAITDAYAARWDYVVISNTGASRSGSVIGVWDGTNIEFFDDATDDIVGSTAGIEFSVQIFGATVNLVAQITSGTWSIRGSRYFIPNNGNGTGPISDNLADGLVYIGNTSNLAQARAVSGAINISNTGVTTLNNLVVSNANVATGAAIAVTKLAALTLNQLVITSGGGVLTTTATPTLTEVGFLSGVGSSIQTQINSKMTDPMLAIGDIIIRNGSNNTIRLGIGSTNQVLTVIGGIPSWQTPSAGFSDPMTTIGDLIVRNGSNVTARLGIGANNTVLTSNGTIAAWTAIPGFTAGANTQVIFNSAGTLTGVASLTFNSGAGTLTATNLVASTLISGPTILATVIGSGGVVSPTARLHTAASSGAAGTAPLKLNAGTLLGILENQTVETDTNHIYYTAGAVRHQLDQQIGGTANEVLKSNGSGFAIGTTIFSSSAGSLLLGDNALAGNRTIQAAGVSANVDILLVPKSSGSSDGTAGSGTVLMGSVGIGIAQPFTVNNSGFVIAPGYHSSYDTNPVTVTANKWYKDKYIEIGAWNMDSTAFVSIPHLLSLGDIVDITAIIINDLGNNKTILNIPLGGTISANSTDIFLSRELGGTFDSTDFDSTGINRGIIKITYRTAG